MDIPDNPLSPANVGAISELLVCANLMRSGFLAFRNVGPNSPFDIVAYHADTKTILRIEVKSGYATRDGSIICGTSKSTKYRDHIDHVAIVVRDAVIYNPPLPIVASTGIDEDVAA